MTLRTRVILIVLFLIGCIVAGIYYIADAKEREREMLLTEVSDFIPIHIDPTELSNNELRLHRYAVLHAIDPVFALAGTDTEELRVDLVAFEESSNAAYIPHQKNIEKEVLYPIRFLFSLTNTEDI